MQTIAYNERIVDGYSFWCISDIFEEMRLSAGPFKEGFGLMTNHGIRKPSYRVFEALHQAGDVRLDVTGGSETVEALALSSGDEVYVFVYNHDIERRTEKTETVCLKIEGDPYAISEAVIDEYHSNPRKAWEDMGSPRYLKNDEVDLLHRASKMNFCMLDPVGGQSKTFTFESLPESVHIFKMRVKK